MADRKAGDPINELPILRPDLPPVKKVDEMAVIMDEVAKQVGETPTLPLPSETETKSEPVKSETKPLEAYTHLRGVAIHRDPKPQSPKKSA